MTRRLLGVAVVAIAIGCEADPAPVPLPAVANEAACAPSVMWKRTGAVVADLGAALELDDDEICTEVGGSACRDVHRVSLGEAEPFLRSLYERPEAVLATTPLTLERLVVSACAARVSLDGQGDPAVFVRFDLGGIGPDPASPEVASTVDDLYRRFLGRSALSAEIEAISALTRAPDGASRSGAEAAKLLCFAVGSSAEFLFY